ncbi:PREDICTED: acid-sensing ion channel 5-like isoform X1 [Branchiostoma belcheri]|uniref:Acid-sensing ion channel 5-like isoform X1 n=1 Tax=Branchiostoma belcheri TaxID=7741 RepID=A0A6P4YAD8_BRABE|nr:PREDICTED: acid-sensing ion channel 5-like isoform X1 [Branchiostoma belcheri]
MTSRCCRKARAALCGGPLDYEFATNTTCHGAAKIANAHNRVHRLLWVLVFLGSFSVCVWWIADRVGNYYGFRTNTEISRRFEDKLIFPAVTVCNFNRYRASKVSNDTLEHLWELLNLHTAVVNKDNATYNASLCWNTPPINATEFADLTKQAGFRLDEDTLIMCKWRDEDCHQEDFEHHFTPYGNCWTFNWNTSSARAQPTAGEGNGLRMLINIHADEYTEPANLDSMDVGLKFLVHDQHDPPKMDSEGLAVAAGTHVYTSIVQQKYINERKPWGQCVPEKTLQYFDRYSLTGCLLECRARRLMNSCNCLPASLPGPADMPHCSPIQLGTCAYEELAKFDQGEEEVGLCNCSVPCEETKYQVSLSYSTWPNKDAPRLFNRSLQDLRENYVSMDIFYQDLNYQTFQQFQTVTVPGMISDIGGQLGFFLGASIITLSEFLEYLILKLIVHRYGAEQEQNVEDPGNKDKHCEKEGLGVKNTDPGQDSDQLQAVVVIPRHRTGSYTEAVDTFERNTFEENHLDAQSNISRVFFNVNQYSLSGFPQEQLTDQSRRNISLYPFIQDTWGKQNHIGGTKDLCKLYDMENGYGYPLLQQQRHVTTYV